MQSEHHATVLAVSPALISLCIDRLQRLPCRPRRTSDHLLLVATCTGRDEDEAAALFVRLVTAAFVCRDARWRQWRAVAASSIEAGIAFEQLVIGLFARLPLRQDLAQSADAFFDALIARMPARGRG